MKRFNVILATSTDDVLGVNSGLPWKSREDMRYFQSLTSYTPLQQKNIVIMGRKTWSSINHSYLKDRILYVVSSHYDVWRQNKQQDYARYYNIEFFPNLNEAITDALMKQNVYKVWIAGGKSIYIQAFHHPNCGNIYWNRIGTTIQSGLTDKDHVTTISQTNYKSHTSQVISTTPLEIHANIGRMGGMEVSYLRLMNDIMQYGERRETRNATTLSLFDKELKWDMRDGFPLLTTKRMFWKGIVEELIFFFRGETQSKQLEEKGVRIWQGNTTREFLNTMKLTDYEEGEMGPMYGYQWRFFGKPYGAKNTNGETGIDQMKEFIDEIKSNPNSRRHLLTTYNPAQVKEGVLYPCHSLVIQGYVDKDSRLSLKMYQRSADVFLGLPFNIASTSLLCVILAKLCGLEPGTVGITIGDAHIYEAHIPACEKQLSRECYPLPTLKPLAFETIKDVEDSKLEDYETDNYKYHPSIRAPMFA